MNGFARRRSRGEGVFGAIIGIGFLIMAVIAGIKVVPVFIHGNDVYDAMDEAANFGNIKPPEKLQYDIFRRGQEAHVPLLLSDIKIVKMGTLIKISAKYEETVDILGYKYKYTFDRSVEKPLF
jgi:hypothetical protein